MSFIPLDGPVPQTGWVWPIWFALMITAPLLCIGLWVIALTSSKNPPQGSSESRWYSFLFPKSWTPRQQQVMAASMFNMTGLSMIPALTMWNPAYIMYVTSPQGFGWSSMELGMVEFFAAFMSGILGIPICMWVLSKYGVSWGIVYCFTWYVCWVTISRCMVTPFWTIFFTCLHTLSYPLEQVAQLSRISKHVSTIDMPHAMGLLMGSMAVGGVLGNLIGTPLYQIGIHAPIFITMFFYWCVAVNTFCTFIGDDTQEKALKQNDPKQCVGPPSPVPGSEIRTTSGMCTEQMGIGWLLAGVLCMMASDTYTGPSYWPEMKRILGDHLALKDMTNVKIITIIVNVLMHVVLGSALKGKGSNTLRLCVVLGFFLNAIAYACLGLHPSLVQTANVLGFTSSTVNTKELAWPLSIVIGSLLQTTSAALLAVTVLPLAQQRIKPVLGRWGVEIGLPGAWLSMRNVGAATGSLAGGAASLSAGGFLAACNTVSMGLAAFALLGLFFTDRETKEQSALMKDEHTHKRKGYDATV